MAYLCGMQSTIGVSDSSSFFRVSGEQGQGLGSLSAKDPNSKTSRCMELRWCSNEAATLFVVDDLHEDDAT